MSVRCSLEDAVRIKLPAVSGNYLLRSLPSSPLEKVKQLWFFICTEHKPQIPGIRRRVSVNAFHRTCRVSSFQNKISSFRKTRNNKAWNSFETDLWKRQKAQRKHLSQSWPMDKGQTFFCRWNTTADSAVSFSPWNLLLLESQRHINSSCHSPRDMCCCALCTHIHKEAIPMLSTGNSALNASFSVPGRFNSEGFTFTCACACCVWTSWTGSED